MVLGFSELNLTETQGYIVRDLSKMLNHIPITELPPKERAYFSILHHLTEGAVLDPGYIIQKLGMLFPQYRWKVKAY